MGEASYFIQGDYPEVWGDSLEAAIDSLLNLWEAQPSLAQHQFGALSIQLTMGSSETQFQIVDPKVLEDLQNGNTSALIEAIASSLEITRDEAEFLFSEMDEIALQVDRLKIQDDPDAWTREIPQKAQYDVLKQDYSQFLGEMESKKQIEEPEQVLETRKMSTEYAFQQVKSGKSVSQVARELGIPRSTLASRMERTLREKIIHPAFRSRKKGQRFDEKQKEVIVETLKESKGNASEAARRLGLSPASVRDVKKREASKKRVRRKASPKKTQAGKHTTRTKNRLLKLVKEGLTASEAARKIGVPGRTARSWVLKEKKKVLQ